MDLLGFLYRKFNHLPSSVRIEACSYCQLNCPDCYMRKNDTKCIIGSGYLKFEDYKKFIEKNFYIKNAELSLSGEIFLNPELSDIIKYSYRKGVSLTAFNGVNFNKVSDEMLDTLVKYKFKGLTISIDGCSNETYSIYRRNGNFDTVIGNIKKLNSIKSKYKSIYPLLQWQFIIFEHNKSEISKAVNMARIIGMDNIYFKFPWSEKDLPKNFDNQKLLVINERKGIFNNGNELIKEIRNYTDLCRQPWTQPQINWNGKLLGCCCSTHNDLDINVFDTTLKKALNSEKMQIMRKMIEGKITPDETIACSNCNFYENMKKNNRYIQSKYLIFN